MDVGGGLPSRFRGAEGPTAAAAAAATAAATVVVERKARTGAVAPCGLQWRQPLHYRGWSMFARWWLVPAVVVKAILPGCLAMEIIRSLTLRRRRPYNRPTYTCRKGDAMSL